MYQAGIYCRVSIEEQNKEGEYSNSIHSQIQMARDYIAEQNDITEVRVYVDDGFSGSNFDRTEFRRMLADIELRTINMVISRMYHGLEENILIPIIIWANIFLRNGFE